MLFGTRALGIEHIGSTAVPGLAAKPIVDVLVTVADVEDESAYAPALVAAGSRSGCGSSATACSAHPSATCTSTSTSPAPRR